jgi:hypothetical protein
MESLNLLTLTISGKRYKARKMNEINIDVNSIKRQVSKQLLDIAKRAGDKIQ